MFEATQEFQYKPKSEKLETRVDRRPSLIPDRRSSNDRRPSTHSALTPEHNIAINELPDKLLMHIVSYVPQKDLSSIAAVCKKWRIIAYDGRLWSRVSLRPDYSGLQVSNVEALVQLIGSRFGSSLRYIELPSELIQVPVLHELANKCPNLKNITLDFSNAMQLHEFNDLNAFPCNLRSMCICLSEVIFLEGFMRKVYHNLGTLEVLHLIGTIELGDEAEEEIYEVINLSKIKAQTPNLRVVDLYGITFIDDTHVELLSTNCIHLECLAINFCLRVKGATLKVLVNRCKKLQTLLMQHCGLEDKHMKEVEWEQSRIRELDITSTELSGECLLDILCRMPGFHYLAVGYCDFFSDKILEELSKRGKLDHLRALNVSNTVSLSESAIHQFLRQYGSQLHGLMINGKPKLAEQFFLNVIPYMKSIKVLVIGMANGWFLRLSTRVHIDQIIICLSQNCPKLERLEVQWDPDTIRYSDNSSKFIDHLRLRCPHIRSLTLSDGEYYEMVKSNFERADRLTIVRTTTNYSTSIVNQLSCYKDLLFN